jgi:hypothetical protein
VTRAIEELKVLGSDFKVINTGNKNVICSVSIELTDDHMLLMKLAEENGGWITFSKTRLKLPQFNSQDRFERTIAFLLNEGMCWEDSQSLYSNASSKGVYTRELEDKGTVYWFPSVMP